MAGADRFLAALTIVLLCAAVTTVVFQRLRQPVVLGYILAGLIVGPHLPIPLVADEKIVHTLSELGVILLMFSLGLEFSLRRLIKLGPTAGLTAVIQCSAMVWLGFVAGQLLHWTTLESIFAGAIIAISSTTIIAKAFDEQGVRGKLREIVVGVLIVEDLIGILLMALLTAISTGAGLSAGKLAVTVLELLGFLAGLVVVGLLVVPRVVRMVVRLGRPETTLVTAVGICFGVSLLAHAFGYSVALGAFIAGSLVAESGEGARIEHLVMPVRDMFAAVFFVSVGMSIDPALIVRHWQAIALLAAVVIAGKVVSVSAGAFLAGNGVRTSVSAGMSLAQIGEFSFIIAGLGVALGATRDFLYAVAVAVSALTTLTTPWMIRGAGATASWVDRKLPAPLQTLATLYGSWVERLRRAPPRRTEIRRLVRFLIVDVALLAVVIVGASLAPTWAAIAASVLALPFVAGVIRISRLLGLRLAEMALPPGEAGRLDLAHAPRRALVVTLQLAIVLAAGLPVVALTQPFLHGFVTASILAGAMLILGVAFWRSASSLHGHVRAGAQMIVEVLAAQTASAPDPLPDLHGLLPGIGEPVTFAVEPESRSVGRSLAELDLRGVTGATVLAITRPGGAVLVPSAGETLQAGDVLAVAGSREAIAAARQLLA